MATPKWQPGTLYVPGALVIPRSDAPPPWPALQNSGFETGDFTGWTPRQIEAGTAFVSSGRPYAGARAARWLGASGGSSIKGGTAVEIVSDTEGRVVPGQAVTVEAMIAQDDTSNSQNYGCVRIIWYDINRQRISHKDAARYVAGNYSHYERSTLTASAPAGAHYARMAVWLSANNQGGMWADECAWSSNVPQNVAGLMFKAVQERMGSSGSAEPTWPSALGQQVTDGEVIWEAVSLSRVVWKAVPLLVSGPTEPNWPASEGAFVKDGTISWEAISRRVTDPKCPQSPYVVIAASKVFAADGDIVAFSATANPLDWSSRDNAGYLPAGLQMYGANPIKAMGLYRGNLVVLNAQGGQVWQVDEDPALMALLDAFPIGSQHHKAMAPISNDLFILTQLGVRTLGVAAGSTNLQAGDVGLPVDDLVQDEMKDGQPFGLYNPNAGQYWLVFPDNDTRVFVYTMNRLGQIGAWTRYEFPFPVDDWAINGEHLYLRSGDEVRRVDVDLESDESRDIPIDGGYGRVPFEWSLQWPWLDFGQMGVTKMVEGFDIIGSGEARIEFGYDQTDGGRWTPGWTLIADSVPGQLLPMPLAAPSIAVRLTYQGSDDHRTSWDALNVHLRNFRVTS